MRRVAPLALALAACAVAPAVPDSADTQDPVFRDVRRVALVRRAERAREPRPKDPLDALRESLEQRGLETATLELGARRDAAGLDQLYARVRTRIEGTPAGDGGRTVERVGEVAPVLDRLAVQAVALYLRFDGPPLLGSRSLAPPPLAGGMRLPPLPTGTARAAALALVGRDGALVWFDWGGGEDPLGTHRRVNAADAVDALLHVLTGEGAEGDPLP